MNAKNLFLGGVVAVLAIKSLRKKHIIKIDPLEVSINLDHYITPFSPGYVAYGDLLIKNKLDSTVSITDINMSLADKQIRQSGMEISVSQENLTYYIRPNDGDYNTFQNVDSLGVNAVSTHAIYIQLNNRNVIIDNFDIKSQITVIFSCKVNGVDYSKDIDVLLPTQKG